MPFTSFDLDPGAVEQAVELADALGSVARLDHDRDLDERGDGERPRVRGLDRLVESTPLGLVVQDRQHGRRVEDHDPGQRGTPCSS